MAIYFDSRYTSDMRLAVKEELLAVAEQTANSAKAAERERCAKIADSFAAEILSVPKNTVDLINRQAELTYTMGYGISAERIAAKIREASEVADAVVVLVNPTTKQPTCWEPGCEIPVRVFDGLYQNVTRVTKQWQVDERERIDEDVERQRLREGAE